MEQKRKPPDLIQDILGEKSQISMLLNLLQTAVLKVWIYVVVYEL
jgi:hypothetical protein